MGTLDKDASPLVGLSKDEQEIMARLLRMPPEQQKAAPKPATHRGEAQRRRRARERRNPPSHMVSAD